MAEITDVEPALAAELARRVLHWYARHRRDLPWRATRDPYRIWVAEIMLQQTRVETVTPYYQRFLEQFPTVSELAAAPLDTVLKAWEGLGYYARARNLHRAAQHVVEDLQVHLPRSAKELVQLPGIGRYTAGAIASIAFGKDVVALDGNLRRVLCRLFGVDDDPSRSRTQRRLEALAHTIMPPGRAGDFNQALMDLSATICLPLNPRCLLCPLQEVCEARREGIQNELPIRRAGREVPHRDVTAGIIWKDEQSFLISQRPVDSMLGGLWEFPGGKRRPRENLVECLTREIVEELGIEIQVGDLCCVVQHSYSHFHMTLYAFSCRHLRGEPRCLGCADWRWVTLADLEQFAFPVADQKIIRELLRSCSDAQPWPLPT
jgi:A/G-specific adenine glycosylase